MNKINKSLVSTKMLLIKTDYIITSPDRKDLRSSGRVKKIDNQNMVLGQIGIETKIMTFRVSEKVSYK